MDKDMAGRIDGMMTRRKRGNRKGAKRRAEQKHR
jgi:hypothetical protein